MPVPKRVSSLLVTADLAKVSALDRDLGFTSVETDDRGCVGYVAGESGVILADRDFAVRCWGERAATALGGRFVPYVFLGQLDGDSVPDGVVLADTRTWFGTREQVVETISGPIVLVQAVG